jgi:hypothetical protein
LTHDWGQIINVKKLKMEIGRKHRGNLCR